MSSRRFVLDGAEIPFEVLQALEDDQLLFFCGAGVSVGTGLPGFEKLTAELYSRLNLGQRLEDGTPAGPTPEREAFERKAFDTVIHLLEQRVGRPELVRRHVIEILTAPVEPDRLELHRSILTLARRRPRGEMGHSGYHLVTTNFDDRFELAQVEPRLLEAAPALGPGGRRDVAPLIYLHGRIGTKESPHDPDGRTLVLTSADFGSAYLRHGWAARFLVEMFRDFKVLLVGYSLSDPPLRYLVDAIASERSRRGAFQRVWALAGHLEADEEQVCAEWRAKGVEPIA
jgi:hypothetical protein